MNTRNIDELNEAAQLLAQQKPLVSPYRSERQDDRGRSRAGRHVFGRALESIDRTPTWPMRFPGRPRVDAMVILKAEHRRAEALLTSCAVPTSP